MVSVMGLLRLMITNGIILAVIARLPAVAAVMVSFSRWRQRCSQVTIGEGSIASNWGAWLVMLIFAKQARIGFAGTRSFSLLDTKKTNQKKVRRGKAPDPNRTALRQRETARHIENRSANLPKLNASRRFKHMERFVFALRSKIPSRATQKDSAGAASACRKLLNAQSAAGNARFLQTFVT